MPLGSTRTETKELLFPHAGWPRRAVGKEEEQGQEGGRGEGDADSVRKSKRTKESPRGIKVGFLSVFEGLSNLVKEVYRGIEGLAGFGTAQGVTSGRPKRLWSPDCSTT